MRHLIPLLVLMCLPAAASALAPACEPIVAAMEKTAMQPRRHTVVEVPTGRIEMIHLDGATYAAIDGKWQKMAGDGLQPERVLATAVRKGEIPMQGCSKVGSEVVEGVATTVYRYSLKGHDGAFAEARAYLSKDGLIHAQSSADTRLRSRFTGVSAPKL